MADVSFPSFYLRAAEMYGWEVPDEHLEVCDWLEGGRVGRVGVLKAFRGFSKSTIAGRYVPWKLRKFPTWRFQLLSATDQDGAKMSRDARNVIDKHPWCRGMRPERAGLWKTHRFEVAGADDARNPSVSAYGIMSNITGGRADECINDDVEVPKTIRTPALRESLRERLDEQIHIIVPGGKILYIGTDHCVESIYKEQIEDGADLLEVPLFRRSVTHIPQTASRDFFFDWRIQSEDELYVLVGMNRPRLLERSEYIVEGVRDYRGGRVRLRDPAHAEERVSIYSGNCWPARFTRAEITFRMKKCRTWGMWDSQYQLQPAQIGQVRLDPNRLVEYEGEPEIRRVNGEITMWLNGMRMTGVSAVWDCAEGKVKADDSAFVVIFADSRGYYYWHIAEALTGDINEQCQAVAEMVRSLCLPAVTVKTTGLGLFVPTILKGHLQRAGLDCGVIGVTEKAQKNVRILDALETPLSGLFLYAHQRVKQGPVKGQMREWDPKVLDQPDDYLDAAAEAIAAAPVRIGKDPNPQTGAREEWRPGREAQDIQVDFGR